MTVSSFPFAVILRWSKGILLTGVVQGDMMLDLSRGREGCLGWDAFRFRAMGTGIRMLILRIEKGCRCFYGGRRWAIVDCNWSCIYASSLCQSLVVASIRFAVGLHVQRNTSRKLWRSWRSSQLGRCATTCSHSVNLTSLTSHCLCLFVQYPS